jgi:hypothetical protein
VQFTLFYDGPLKSNRGTKDKHQIRRHFHGQLKELLGRKSYDHFENALNKQFKRFLENHRYPSPLDLFKMVCLGSFCFIPFITEKHENVARLHITLLTSEEPGRAVTQGGDLDNRIKTLLDALRCPKTLDEIQQENPGDDEDPFFCLLEDDALIVELSVTADRLLRPRENPSNAVVLVRVTPEATPTILGQTRIVLG